TVDVTGMATGPGPQRASSATPLPVGQAIMVAQPSGQPGALPLLPPLPVLPPPPGVPLLAPLPFAAAAAPPDVPVIPEAQSALLAVLGLLARGLLAGWRRP